MTFRLGENLKLYRLQKGLTPPHIQLGMDGDTDADTETMLNTIRKYVTP